MGLFVRGSLRSSWKCVFQGGKCIIFFHQNKHRFHPVSNLPCTEIEHWTVIFSNCLLLVLGSCSQTQDFAVVWKPGLKRSSPGGRHGVMTWDRISFALRAPLQPGSPSGVQAISPLQNTWIPSPWQTSHQTQPGVRLCPQWHRVLSSHRQ